VYLFGILCRGSSASAVGCWPTVSLSPLSSAIRLHCKSSLWSAFAKESGKLVMPWPKSWFSSTKDETDSKASVASKTTQAWESATETVNEARESIRHEIPATLPSHLKAFSQPQTIVATAVLTTACLGLFKFYRSYLRRIPQATNITPGFLRRRSLVGKVTSVGDGDNFRFYHTPGGRLAGWGWLPGRRVPTDKKELKDKTVRQTQDYADMLGLTVA